jgi:hypothetical protein
VARGIGASQNGATAYAICIYGYWEMPVYHQEGAICSFDALLNRESVIIVYRFHYQKQLRYFLPFVIDTSPDFS